MDKPIVLKLGGHLLFSTENSFEEYCRTLANVVSSYKIHIVVGGGQKAREYIKIGRNLGLNESILDQIGINISQLNAYLAFNYLSKFTEIYFVKNFEELVDKLNSGKKVICGGLFPSISTTTVACIIAELCNGFLFYVTDVDGVFDKDPKLYKDAKLFKELSIEELISLLSKTQDFRAGEYKLFDQHSLEIMKRSKIPVRVFNGKNPENIIKVLRNENIGTLIYYK